MVWDGGFLHNDQLMFEGLEIGLMSLVEFNYKELLADILCLPTPF